MDNESESITEEKEIENTNDEQTLKKGRHRKKQLYNTILQQMEFYFSDSNLTKDRFLSQLLQQSEYVDLDVFLKFNKIRKLTSNIEDIQKAVKNSNLIELSEDKSRIRRKVPIKQKTNVDECTIYVERLKSDATHEWVSSVFSEFGTVVYVSIPKFKHNNVIKGFAFVEFDKEEEAEKALNYFESIGCKMPSNTEPDHLCSIATFEGNNEENNLKRKFDEIDERNDYVNEKKLKVDGEVSESEDTDWKKKKKLKKEHKKKNYLKELGLQVLSKKEWKKMRNKYLDLQKKKMKEFKKHLHKAKYGKTDYTEKANEKSESNETKYEFVEGVIVKIKLNEAVVDIKKLKNEIKSACPEVQYVDVPNVGSSEIFVRCSTKESALNFTNLEIAGKKEVLKGEEEAAYWKKINEDRDKKMKKVKKKQRGRDKLLKKAKHTKFDE